MSHFSVGHVTVGHVTVDQKSLIERILSRYPSQFTVLRELIQNSDDAKASVVTININNNHLSFENNGYPFREEDWQRIITIASGNPDETSIGCFGVGFYSVFSLTDEPAIYSGTVRIEFFWENRSLKFRRYQNLSVSEKSVFLFPNIPSYRLKDWSLQSLGLFLVKTIAFTRNITSIQVNVNRDFFEIKKEHLNPEIITQTFQIPPKINTVYFHPLQIFKQEIKISFNTKTNHVHIATFLLVQSEVKVLMSPEWISQISSRLSKKLPTETKVQLLYHINIDQTYSDSHLKDLYPLPNNGHLFVGFSTNQKTGTGFHISAPFFTTMEREHIDFNPIFVDWNIALIAVSGIIARIQFDNFMRGSITDTSIIETYISYSFSRSEPNQNIGITLFNSFFEFGGPPLIWSSLNKPLSCLQLKICDPLLKVGNGILEPLISVPHVPFSLIDKCDQLSPQHHLIHTLKNKMDFLSVNEFLQSISLLSYDQVSIVLKWLIELLNSLHLITSQQWFQLFQKTKRQVLVKLSNNQSVPLETFKTFADKEFIYVPLSSDILPLEISKYFTEIELKEKLKFQELQFFDWFNWIAKLPCLEDPKASPFILALISKRFSSLNLNQQDFIIQTLSTISCIPTTHNPPMKIPSVCYFREQTFLNEGLPCITLNLLEVNQNFLIRLGVHTQFSSSDIIKKIIEGKYDWDILKIANHFIETWNSVTEDDWQFLRNCPILPCKGIKNQYFFGNQLCFPDSVLEELGFLILDIPGNIQKTHPSWLFFQRLGVCERPSLKLLLNRIILLSTQNLPLLEKILDYFRTNFSYYEQDYSSFGYQHEFILTSCGLKKPEDSFIEASPFSFPAAHRSFVKDLKFASQLKISKHPPLEKIFSAFTNPSTSVQVKVQFLDYLVQRWRTETDFDVNHWNYLQNCAFIPVSISPKETQLIQPAFCFIFSTDLQELYGNLLNYYQCPSNDYSQFLKLCNVKETPSVDQLVENLLLHHNRYFQSLGIHDGILISINDEKSSFHHYYKFLITISTRISELSQSKLNELSKFEKLLAFQNSNTTETHFLRLCNSSQCYVIDDELLQRCLKAPFVPDSEVLESLYLKLNCKYLSQSVVETFHIPDINSAAVTPFCDHIRNAIYEKYPLFLYDKSGKLRDSLVDNAKQLLGSCQVFEVKTIQKLIQFEDRRVTTNEQISSQVTNNRLIFFINSNVDCFDLANQIAKLIFTSGKMRNSGTAEFDLILEKRLEDLEKKGYPVHRANRLIQQRDMDINTASKYSDFVMKDQLNFQTQHIDYSSSNANSIPIHQVFKKLDLIHSLSIQGSRDQISQIIPTLDNSLHKLASCDTISTKDMKKITIIGTIPIYAQNEELALSIITKDNDYLRFFVNSILEKLTKKIGYFKIGIFIGINTDTIAYNSEGEIVFNFRCFLDLLNNKFFNIQNNNYSELELFWELIFYHELVHNIEHNHNANFAYLLNYFIFSAFRNYFKS